MPFQTDFRAKKLVTRSLGIKKPRFSKKQRLQAGERSKAGGKFKKSGAVAMLLCIVLLVDQQHSSLKKQQFIGIGIPINCCLLGLGLLQLASCGHAYQFKPDRLPGKTLTKQNQALI